MPPREDQSVDLGSRHLRATKAGGVLRVVIDRPERRNALHHRDVPRHQEGRGAGRARPRASTCWWSPAPASTSASAARWAASTRAASRSTARPTASTCCRSSSSSAARRSSLMAINGMCQGGGLNMTLMSDLVGRLRPRHLPRPRAAARRRRLLPRRAPREPRRHRRAPSTCCSRRSTSRRAEALAMGLVVARRAARRSSTPPSRRRSAGSARPARARARR